MDNRKLFAYILLMLCIFLLFQSQQQRAELQRREAEQEAARSAALIAERESKVQELKNKAAENPDYQAPQEPERQMVVLGSMAADAGYPLLVTLDNQGAGIHRIEVVERDKKGEFRYRNLQDEVRTGYAGHLALENQVDGIVVMSVPAGSPAALAENGSDPSAPGLVAGDKIVGWTGHSGDVTRTAFELWTKTWRPSEVVEVQVKRGESEPITFKLTLEDKPLDIVRAEDDLLREQVPGNDPTLSCLTTLAKVDGLALLADESVILGLEKTLSGKWDVKPLEVDNGEGVEFTMNITPYLELLGSDAKLELVKQYRLHKPSAEAGKDTVDHWQFHVEFSTIVRNLGDKEHKVAIRQDGVNGISLEGWWYPTKISPYFFSAAGARDVIFGDGAVSHSIETTRTLVHNAINAPASPDTELIGPANSDLRRTLNYIGIDTQSFTAALVPAKVGGESSLALLERAGARVLNSDYRDTTKLAAYKQQAANIGFWVETSSKTLPANGEVKLDYLVFAGPKEPELLAAYGLDNALEYGWHIFGFFAKRLGWILHFFYSIVGNFGVAIIMLTILVRSLMYPVSRKMAINAQKMQAVQPHTVKLREAFKEDPRKMMTAQQLLMKKAGVNQFAGCLPALIQLPIVIGLYRCVSVDVGLRQQPLIPGLDWCSNLAAPDMLYNWHSWMPDFLAGRGTGFFGPYFNILPLITIVLFIVQQKVLMPKPTDEQTAMAQKMMMFMTVAMGVLFFRVPAGLCIYFITSSTWSLLERWIIRRSAPKDMKVELPENVAAEIISTVNKMGAGPAAVRTAAAAPKTDRPKAKYTKPPETLADVFPKWFGKKDEDNSPAAGSSGNKPAVKGRGPKGRGSKSK